MRYVFLLLTVFLTCHNIHAQVSNDLIIEQIEHMSEGSEGESDYSELIEAYWNISENPININSENIDQLAEMKFISIFQLENIKKYQREYGNFQVIEELYEVEGLDSTSVEMIRHLICFDSNHNENIRFQDLFRFGKNKLLFELNQCLNKKKGYAEIDDESLYQKPNSVYLGSPQKIYLRYNYSSRDKIEAGIVLEKDPGEYIIKQNVNDSIRRLLGNKCYSGFDFFSFHICLKDIAFIKTLAIGDYKLSFGQGVTMGSGMAFTSKGSSLLRRNKKITASKSANEAYYLRGFANTLKYRNMELSIFYSNKKSDANIVSYDSLSNTPLKISSLQQSGLHRTYNEIIDRKAVRQQLYGLNLSYRNDNFQIGYTLHTTHFNTELDIDKNIYNTFYFKGKDLTNQGIDFYYVLKKILLYGEFAMSGNKGTAGIFGITMQPTGYIELTLLYRNYAKNYQSLYSNAFASGSKNRNEEGYYFSSAISIAPNWELITTLDIHKSEWLKSNAYAPSHGYEFDSQLNYQPNKNVLLFFEYRNKNDMKNTKRTDLYQKYLADETSNMIRFHATYSLSEKITLKNRAEYHFNEHEDGMHHSYLLYQDVIYNLSDTYSIAFRYELFDAEKGNIYAYENDILYSFAVNSLSDKGTRIYLVGKIKLWKQIQLSCKIGFTFYDNKGEIGAGLETIESRWKGDGKIQVIWTF